MENFLPVPGYVVMPLAVANIVLSIITVFVYIWRRRNATWSQSIPGALSKHQRASLVLHATFGLASWTGGALLYSNVLPVPGILFTGLITAVCIASAMILFVVMLLLRPEENDTTCFPTAAKALLCLCIAFLLVAFSNRESLMTKIVFVVAVGNFLVVVGIATWFTLKEGFHLQFLAEATDTCNSELS